MIILTEAAARGSTTWVDVLRAAGVPVLGEALPSGWSEHARASAGPEFFAALRDQGLYFKTNPDPLHQTYLSSEEAAGFAMAASPNAILRTERAFLEAVVVSVPSPLAVADAGGPSALLLWWSDVFGMLRDASTRRFGLRLVTEAAVVRAPVETVEGVFGFLGLAPRESALEAACEVARGATARVRGPVAGETGLPASILDVFEELHARVDEGRGFDRPFLERVYAVHEAVKPFVLRAEVASLRAQAERLRAKRAAQ
jgi:hypothetical protein